MIRRSSEATIVNTTFICALLSVGGGRAFTVCCARRLTRFTVEDNRFSPRSIFSQSWLMESVVPPKRTALIKPRTEPRHGMSVAMSSSTLPSSTPLSTSPQELPLKRHRNTFLSPRPEHGPSTDQLVSSSQEGPLALVVLNTTDDQSKALLPQLWSRAVLRVCADGGANRLYDSFGANLTGDRERYIPDMIVGDLDSLRPDVATFYEALGTEVKRRPDQDHTDFEKCLIEIETRLSSTSSTSTGEATSAEVEADVTEGTPASATVVGLGAFGGRFDHEMAAISLLHSYTSRFDRLVLFGAGNLAFLLLPGYTHVLELQESLEGPTVGLMPIGGACKSVTTEGLRWNLEGGSLEFGMLVSTSNEAIEKEVWVKTDAPLVWTAETKLAPVCSSS